MSSDVVLKSDNSAKHIWWMRDNHTFVSIPTRSMDDALLAVMEAWKDDHYGMLCGSRSDGTKISDYLHGSPCDPDEFRPLVAEWLGKHFPTENLPDRVKSFVQKMADEPGIWILGDTGSPGAEIPIVSIGGKLFAMSVDQELDPSRFLPSVFGVGPFRLRDEYVDHEQPEGSGGSDAG